MKDRTRVWSGVRLAVGLVFCVRTACGVLDTFDAPTFSDGELVGQASWGGGLGGFVVSGAATGGHIQSVVSPGAVKQLTRALTTANTGVTDTNPTGSCWATFEMTLHATSGTAQLITLDLLRDGNNYKAMSFNVYQSGNVILNYNVGNVPSAQVNVTLSGILTNEVKAVFHVQVDFDNLRCRLFKDHALVAISGVTDGWMPYADRRGIYNNEPDLDLHLGTLYPINRNPTSGYVDIDNLGFGTEVKSGILPPSGTCLYVF